MQKFGLSVFSKLFKVISKQEQRCWARAQAVRPCPPGLGPYLGEATFQHIKPSGLTQTSIIFCLSSEFWNIMEMEYSREQSTLWSLGLWRNLFPCLPSAWALCESVSDPEKIIHLGLSITGGWWTWMLGLVVACIIKENFRGAGQKVLATIHPTWECHGNAPDLTFCFLIGRSMTSIDKAWVNFWMGEWLSGALTSPPASGPQAMVQRESLCPEWVWLWLGNGENPSHWTWNQHCRAEPCLLWGMQPCFLQGEACPEVALKPTLSVPGCFATGAYHHSSCLAAPHGHTAENVLNYVGCTSAHAQMPRSSWVPGFGLRPLWYGCWARVSAPIL